MSFVDDARRAQAESKARTLRALAGLPEPEPVEPEPAKPTSTFDGGARTRVPLPPESHGVWLGRVIEAQRGRPSGYFNA